MSRPKEGWYVGRAKDCIHEMCTGFVETGYWYAGGPEEEPYSYRFWGLIWRGKYTIGIGHVVHEDILKVGEDA